MPAAPPRMTTHRREWQWHERAWSCSEFPCSNLPCRPALVPITPSVIVQQPSRRMGDRRRLTPREDRLGDIADRLDRIPAAGETHDAAWTGFQAFVAPGKGADNEALIEHFFHVAADILGVDQALGKRVAVEWEDIFDDVATGFLVHVVKVAEKFLARLADFLLEAFGDVGAHVADGCVH